MHGRAGLRRRRSQFRRAGRTCRRTIAAVAPGAANGSDGQWEWRRPEPAASPQLPLWLQAAVRLGTRFLRVAAAGEPPATSSFMPAANSASPCCCDCGRVHPPVMDEYYFWLVNSEYYDPTVLNVADPTLYQDADWGVAPGDMTSDWHRPAQLAKTARLAEEADGKTRVVPRAQWRVPDAALLR